MEAQQGTEESPDKLFVRAVTILREILQFVSDENARSQKPLCILIVAHCAMNIALVRALLGFETFVPCETCSISHISWEPSADKWKQLALGVTDHWSDRGLITTTVPFWGKLVAFGTQLREWGLLR